MQRQRLSFPPGLVQIFINSPRLAPWAALCRRSAATFSWTLHHKTTSQHSAPSDVAHIDHAVTELLSQDCMVDLGDASGN
jgi:hypothetical protein